MARLNMLGIPIHWPRTAKLFACLFTPNLVASYLSFYDKFFNHYRTNVISAMVLSLIMLLIAPFIQTRWLASIQFNKMFFAYYPQFSRGKLKLGDPLRFIIQSCYLLIFRHRHHERRIQPRHFRRRIISSLLALLPSLLAVLKSADVKISRKIKQVIGREALEHSLFKSVAMASFWEKPHVRNLILVLVLMLTAVFVTVPFSLQAQAVFMSLILFVAYSLRGIKGRMPTMIMILLSLTTSTRYIWWRYTETLNWDDPLALALGIGLLLAETYAWLVLILGFFQTVRPLQRKPAKLPPETDEWPTVDIYIPTYNEPLSVVRLTTIAAISIDWPQDKLRIYILDDGKRPEFKQFADDLGVGYLTRPNNNHAKAGNLNHAMQYTQGDYIAIFDCDHVPVRSFLQMTMGCFLKDPKVCLVQTPHHFFSADPFERNLGNFSHIPNENMLFYGLIQDGNDMWNATFFCGSCAVLKRQALNEVGGFAFETVTEDAHTALRMQRAGYKTAYINIPQAAGLATESLSAHIGQRIRWARGMAQIFRIDNPLSGKGLDLTQRFCYLNAMLHFISGIPRLVFLTAPLALIFFDAYIIYAHFMAIFLYVVPTLIQVKITNSRIQGIYRYSFWGEVYETVIAWYILKPTTVALINPAKGKFNVTEKGGLVEHEHFDWSIAKPYLILVLLNIAGLIIGSIRMVFGELEQIGILLISMTWAAYNLIIVGAAVAVAAESKQVRQSHRISGNFPAVVRLSNGHTLKITVTDYCDSGIGIESEHAELFKVDDKVELLMTRGYKQFAFSTAVCNVRAHHVGLSLGQLTQSQQIAFVQCTFSRADAWLSWQQNFVHDQLSVSFREVRQASLRGFKNLIIHAPAIFVPLIKYFIGTVELFASYLPRRPQLNELKNYE